jgi:hypothetical protein
MVASFHGSEKVVGCSTNPRNICAGVGDAQSNGNSNSKANRGCSWLASKIGAFYIREEFLISTRRGTDMLLRSLKLE